ncbi:MAG: hypothetical protein J2P28_12075, partial [Actinobacteria bacterium]|nr:hypothetical protein [Actinomycetota bacterium]
MTGPSAERSGRSGGEVGTEPGPAAAGPAPTGGPVAARPARAQPGPAHPGPAHPDSGVPRLLQQTAAWSWRLLLTGLVIYLAFRLAVELRLVILPLIAALLLTALLEPL